MHAIKIFPAFYHYISEYVGATAVSKNMNVNAFMFWSVDSATDIKKSDAGKLV